MPCHDSRDDEVTYYSWEEEKLKDRLHNSERAFCEMSQAFKQANSQKFCEAMMNNKFLLKHYEQHCAEDEERWYNHYKQFYVDSRDALVQAVYDGKLPRV